MSSMYGEAHLTIAANILDSGIEGAKTVVCFTPDDVTPVLTSRT
jgi:hypothetical protein